MDLSNLLCGYVKVFTWICQTDYMFSEPFAKQNQAEVWSLLIGLKSSIRCKDSMPWIRCAFGNVFFGNSNLAVLSLDLQTVWFTWSYCYQQSNHFWKISSISLLLSFGWSWWTCEKGKISENCHYPPRVLDLFRLHRLDCIRARSALGSFPFLKYFIKISLLIGVPISHSWNNL